MRIPGPPLFSPFFQLNHNTSHLSSMLLLGETPLRVKIIKLANQILRLLRLWVFSSQFLCFNVQDVQMGIKK